jgi:hypothetical protein
VAVAGLGLSLFWALHDSVRSWVRLTKPPLE